MQAEFTIGGYSNKLVADNDARSITSEDVFKYRTALFASPAQYKVSAKVRKAETVIITGSTMTPYEIVVTVDCEGSEADVNKWVADTRRRTESTRPRKI